MKCPDCGAENMGNAVYCGRCARQLREFPTATSPEDEEVSPLPAELERIASGRIPKGLTIMLVLGAVLSTVLYLTGEHETKYLLGILTGLIVLAPYVVARLWGRGAVEGSMKYARKHMRPGTMSATGGQSLVARAMALSSLAGFIMIAAFGCLFLCLAIYAGPSLETWFWIVPAAMAAAFLGIIPLTVLRNPTELYLTKDGIAQDAPIYGSTLWLTRDDIERVEVRGRILKVELRDAPFGMRRPTFILLCDASKLGEVSQWAGSFTVSAKHLKG